MLTPLPYSLMDGNIKPTEAIYAPGPSRPDGGYNWGQRRFMPPQSQGTMPQDRSPFAPDMGRQPVMAPHNPVPQQQPVTLAQLRNMMTQLHMQQMVNRLQKHAAHHAGG